MTLFDENKVTASCSFVEPTT